MSVLFGVLSVVSFHVWIVSLATAVLSFAVAIGMAIWAVWGLLTGQSVETSEIAINAAIVCGLSIGVGVGMYRLTDWCDVMSVRTLRYPSWRQ